MGDLFAFRGASDGANATGTFPLYTAEMEKGTTVLYIEVDKGMVAKIWGIEVDGPTIDVIIQYSPDDGATWQELKRIDHADAGHLRIEHFKKPIIVEAKNDTTRLRVNWADSAPAVSWVTVNIEFDVMKD